MSTSTQTPLPLPIRDVIAALKHDLDHPWDAPPAPGSVTEAGVTPPPLPPHGPWRRLDAQTREGDARTVLLPEPAGPLMLLVGCAALYGLNRRRSD